MKYLLVIALLFMAFPAMAETVYVKSNAVLAEVVPEAPFVVTAEMKQKLVADAPVHPVYGVKYITPKIAKIILGISKAEAKQVISQLLDAGSITDVGTRYSELYPTEPETP